MLSSYVKRNCTAIPCWHVTHIDKEIVPRQFSLNLSWKHRVSHTLRRSTKAILKMLVPLFVSLASIWWDCTEEAHRLPWVPKCAPHWVLDPYLWTMALMESYQMPRRQRWQWLWFPDLHLWSLFLLQIPLRCSRSTGHLLWVTNS